MTRKNTENIVIKPAFQDEEVIRQLFGEYTTLLEEGDPEIWKYLTIQNYSLEIQHLEDKYGLPNGRLYIAWVNNQPAGCIALRKLSEMEGEACEMKRLYVRPEFRGYGIAARLVETILQDAIEVGYRAIYLDTLSFLQDAIRLYFRFGFYEIPPYNNSPMQATVFMKRDLTSDGRQVYQKLQQKKAVIFDLDGTLVDSMWMWKSIDIEYLERFGYSCPPDLQQAIEGMSFSETAVYFKERFQLTDTIETIKQTWTDMCMEKYRNDVPLKKGARQFLDYLANSGYKIGIATSNGRELVDVVLDSLQITSCFQVTATACEVAAGKPAPDIYLKVASELQVLPEECIVFEDIPAGILAGKAASMTVCAIEDKYSLRIREEKCRLADFFINDYDEILINAPSFIKTEQRTNKYA